MDSEGWGPAPDIPTTPDHIDREVLNELRLLDGERVRRVWKTGRGFLVMTNLRCAEIWRKPQLFARSEWEAGPSIFFYNLAAPRVMFHRYLRLSEEHEEHAVALHLYVRDPYTVAQEVQEARRAGQNEWMHRRTAEEARLRQAQARTGPLDRAVFREMVKVRCEFCGNLMSVTASRCPSCGAPQH
jgi:hypothetical protein